MAKALPLMHLHGMSSGDLGPARGEFVRLGRAVVGGVITRLTAMAGQAGRLRREELSGADYVYV